ncbi:MAG: hypothetical protein RJA09_2461 [Pseudomonadota bacterium]
MMVTAGYFLLGGLPLLVLQHDTPLDARFVRGFFRVYCKAAMYSATGATVGYALWGRVPFAMGALLLALLAVAIKRTWLPAMQGLEPRMLAQDATAVGAFRRLHLSLLSLNLVQLVLIVWGVTRISF